MKNIFKTNIKIPSNVKLYVKENILFLKGPQGLICLNVSFLKKNFLTKNKKKIVYSSFFRLFQKQLLGVCLKFVVRLTFVGTGFRIEEVSNGFIKLKLGFSHLVFVRIPDYINIFMPKKTLLVIESIDDQLLKEFCSQLILLKSPDAYKGKGILFKNQILTLKEGKKK
jgi:large subunit ribosomal protein L6